MTVAFVGLSHLGLVSSLAAASKGFEVVAYDPDRARCDALTSGHVPILEAGLPELLASCRGHIRFTDDASVLKACELIVCAADVPTGEDARSDLSIITQLLDTIVREASPGTTLVVLSQVPPGFTRRFARTCQSHGVVTCYQVETLIFGCAVKRALQPERFIIGCADPSAPLPEAYAALLSAFWCPILPMGYESAEMAKLSVNAMLAASVCAANALAELCEAIGADWSDIIPALISDRRIGPHAYVRPGLGLAGGNMERDLATIRSLAQEHGTDAGIINAWLAHSRARREWVLRLLHRQVLSRLPDPVIAIWGLAYKPGTNSTKHSAALSLVEALRNVPVRAYDPHVRLNGAGACVTQTASALEACRGADALAIMTPWPEFAEVRPMQVRELMRGRVLIDPFGSLERVGWTQAGFEYRCLGAPAPEASV